MRTTSHIFYRGPDDTWNLNRPGVFPVRDLVTNFSEPADIALDELLGRDEWPVSSLDVSFWLRADVCSKVEPGEVEPGLIRLKNPTLEDGWVELAVEKLGRDRIWRPVYEGLPIRLCRLWALPTGIAPANAVLYVVLTLIDKEGKPLGGLPSRERESV